MINARPNLNGNTPDDFASAYSALVDAGLAIEAAYKALSSNVINGRNYQHAANADELVIADRRRVQEDIRKAKALLGEIASDIADVYDKVIGDAA